MHSQLPTSIWQSEGPAPSITGILLVDVLTPAATLWKGGALRPRLKLLTRGLGRRQIQCGPRDRALQCHSVKVVSFSNKPATHISKPRAESVLSPRDRSVQRSS